MSGKDQLLPAVFAAPGRYIQGRGAINRLGEVLERLGSNRPLILRDAAVADVIGKVVEEIVGAFEVEFRGECSPEEIKRVTRLMRREGADALVGVGGGKVLDTAKAVSHPASIPLVTAPTVASSDAPTSSLSVIYNEDGSFLGPQLFGRNPDAVVVDTEIIARAPARFLVAGMGDGLATYFEADSSSKTHRRTVVGGTSTLTALTLARLCYDTILEYGVPAKLAVERDAVTPAVERVVEANTLLSGIGFESGGLAAAHAIHNGLTVLHNTHDYLHGEKVAFGVISMLFLEGRPTEVIEEVVGFCLEVSLPVTLGDIGLQDASREDLYRSAEAACAPEENIHNEPFRVSAKMVLDAMLAADAFGHRYQALSTRMKEGPHRTI